MLKMMIVCLMVLFVPNNFAKSDIVNGNFESYPVEERDMELFPNNLSSGWMSSDLEIEIWGNLYRGIPSSQGIRFTSLYAEDDLYQDFYSDVNNPIFWQFSHRPRSNYDYLLLEFTDLGQDMIYGNADDRTIHTEIVSSQLPKWTTYSGLINPIGSRTRVSFYSIRTTSGNGNNDMGNYLDDVIINNSIPQPGAFSLLFLCLLCLNKRKAK